jgi:hypothetical protein
MTIHPLSHTEYSIMYDGPLLFHLNVNLMMTYLNVLKCTISLGVCCFFVIVLVLSSAFPSVGAIYVVKYAAV